MCFCFPGTFSWGSVRTDSSSCPTRSTLKLTNTRRIPSTCTACSGGGSDPTNASKRYVVAPDVTNKQSKSERRQQLGNVKKRTTCYGNSSVRRNGCVESCLSPSWSWHRSPPPPQPPTHPSWHGFVPSETPPVPHCTSCPGTLRTIGRDVE